MTFNHLRFQIIPAISRPSAWQQQSPIWYLSVTGFCHDHQLLLIVSYVRSIILSTRRNQLCKNIPLSSTGEWTIRISQSVASKSKSMSSQWFFHVLSGCELFSQEIHLSLWVLTRLLYFSWFRLLSSLTINSNLALRKPEKQIRSTDKVTADWIPPVQFLFVPIAN